MSQDFILETEELTKEFAGFVAVNDVDLRVERGTIHALIGPNGAGKTTCFNLLTKFLTPTRGRILFNGRDITALGAGRRRAARARALVPDLGGLSAPDACWRTCASRCSASAAAPSISGARSACSTALDERAHGADRPTSGWPTSRSARRSSCPTAASARSKSPPRWRSIPRCCCSTSRWPAWAHEDIERISALIKTVAANRTVLMVEHNLSRRRRPVATASPCWRAARCWPRATTRPCRRTRACSRPISGSGMPEAERSAPLLTVAATCRPGTASRTSCTASTFDVRAGEVVTLLGRNGAGKTTTLKSIMGIVGQPHAARSRFEGAETDRPAVATRIARAGHRASVPRSAASSPASTSRRTCCCRRRCAPGGLALDAHLRAVSQPARSGCAARAPSCRAASSRCWRSAASCAPARGCCCSTSRPKGLAPVIVQQIGRTIAHAEGAGLHDPAGRAEFPLRRDGRRPPLRDGARPHRRHDSPTPSSRPTSTSCTTISASEATPSACTTRTGRNVNETAFARCDRSSRPLLACGTAQAQTRIDVKIGVLNDMSGLYADIGGAGSVVAAQDGGRGFQRGRQAASRSRSSRPTTRTSRTSAPTSRASGTTSTRST